MLSPDRIFDRRRHTCTKLVKRRTSEHGSEIPLQQAFDDEFKQKYIARGPSACMQLPDPVWLGCFCCSCCVLGELRCDRVGMVCVCVCARAHVCICVWPADILVSLTQQVARKSFR